ncbi:hypothetical protein D6B99_16610 [Arachidicoccus soli]|uniref:Uncharacterized protein n=1 Tax=Arachidicoccus soli TaxID=2341117 RepID=A0A386HT30_9BACT|nr:hypothetical protein D6B99_16610 [Arachidicoccus soli]
MNRWPTRLKALESSFGGVGPKAYSIGEKTGFWIAKLLSKNDTIDKRFWELASRWVSDECRSSNCRILNRKSSASR